MNDEHLSAQHADAGMDELTRGIIGAVIEVSRVLGPGFLERVYRRALAEELRLRGIRAAQEVKLQVKYKGVAVGDYVADIVVGDRVVLELKCAKELAGEHVAQSINYLKATGLKVGLLINFQSPKAEWRRIVHGYAAD